MRSNFFLIFYMIHIVVFRIDIISGLTYFWRILVVLPSPNRIEYELIYLIMI